MKILSLTQGVGGVSSDLKIKELILEAGDCFH